MLTKRCLPQGLVTMNRECTVAPPSRTVGSAPRLLSRGERLGRLGLYLLALSLWGCVLVPAGMWVARLYSPSAIAISLVE